MSCANGPSWSASWVTNEWDTIIPNLLDDQYDTIMAGMSITDERDELIDFTQAYFPPSPSVYVALAGAGDAAVSGTVGAQVETIHAAYLADAGATYVEYELADELVEAVVAGDVDAILVDREFAHDTIAESGDRLAVVGPAVALGGGVGIGVRETDGELKDKLDEAIDAMKADGTLDELIREWFGEDAETFG